ncbi:MAG: glycosyltransferase family 4 protein [Microscillaceae bacterium]|nr:glycosyltransferase family 4 protein [Microscillaceae bacterium]
MNWTDDNKFFPAESDEERQQARAKYGILEGETILISVGGCIETKNQIDIIKALPLILEKHPLVRYFLLGDGALRPKYQAMAEELGLAEKIVFVGNTTEVRHYLIASDIYVMPSKYEGLSISLLEACYCGLSSVIYDNWGLKDLVIHQKTGLIVPNNYIKLAEAIIKLTDNPQMRKSMGMNAREFVMENYEIKKIYS